MDFKQYPSYKDSGVEWLGGVPEHWSSIAIKFLATEKNSLFIDGDWIESKDISDEGIKYITTGNVSIGAYKEKGSGFISDKTFYELSCKEVFENDILISRLNLPVGRSCLVPNLNCRVVTSVDNVIFRPDAKYSREYLVYLFSSLNYLYHTETLARGATMQRISRTLLGDIRISIPKLQEQNQIISFLDSETSRIDNLIAKQEKLIEKLEEHRKSVISHAVTKGLDPNVPMRDSGVEWLGEVPEHWKVSSLKRICEVKDGTHDTPSYIEFSESAFPLVTSKNLKRTGLTLNNCKYISKLDYENIIKRSNVKKNDILMPMIGTVGGAVIVNTDEPFAIKNVALFKINNKICNKWLCYVLNSSLIDMQFLLFKNGGVQDFIGLNDLRNLIVPNIPLSQQKLITNYLDKQVYKIDHSIDKQRELIEKLKNYRTSIISHAVTGKIDVRDLVA